MEKKYKILRFIASIRKTLAWLVLILGILLSVGALLFAGLGNIEPLLQREVGLAIPGMLLGVVFFLGGSLGALFCFVSLYTTGELLLVLIAIESNTRALTAPTPLPEQPAPSRYPQYPPTLTTPAAAVTPPPPTYNPAVLETPPPPAPRNHPST